MVGWLIGSRTGGILADRFDKHATCLSASNGNPATMDATLEGITERSAAKVLDRFPGDESHLSEPGRDPIDSVNSDNLALLAGRKLIEGRQFSVSVIENQSQ